MRLILTGGGTGGHIYPNIAIVEAVRRGEQREQTEQSKQSIHGKLTVPTELLYIGSRHGMEREIVTQLGIPYKGIFCGKLRRYFSFLTLRDFWLIPLGFLQSFFIIWKFKPDVIFSKGGYVSVPVILAGFLLGKKIIIHDSDSIPGLTTKICARLAHKICLGYEEAAAFFPKNKVVITGIPLRLKVMAGNRKTGLELCHFNEQLPMVLVFGGSLGSETLNKIIQTSLATLTKHCQIAHLVGGNNLKFDFVKIKNYQAFGSVGDNITHLYAACELIISRAGANAIAEIQTWGKPSILIPLSKKASHGDQISNAKILQKHQGCVVIEEESLTAEVLTQTILDLLKDKKRLQILGKRAKVKIHLEATKKVMEIIETIY